MDRKVFTLLLVFLFSLFCVNATAQVEYVFSNIVADNAIFIEALDGWFASDDSKAGQTAILLESVINGEDTATHTLIIDYPDYESLELILNKIPASGDFAKYESRYNTVATSNWTGLSLRVMDNGKSWKEGDYVWAAGVQVSRGENQTYTNAFKEMLDSKIGKQAPGLMRLLATRAGSNNSHVVIFSAPTFTALNEFVDSLTDSEEYVYFMSQVKAISVLVDPSISRVSRIWK